MSLDIRSFQKILRDHRMFFGDDKLIVAVSGGVDSVVMLDLVVKSNAHVIIAHVNYGLRGQESDDDEAFVRSLSENYAIPFFLRKVKADELRNKGIQEAARSIRYNWFHGLMKETGSSYVLIGHNKDDQGETMVHQFVRGGGLTAIAGMRIKNKEVLRPLLPFSRNEIIEYARINNLVWREDSSNADSKYTRNKIRHEILPSLMDINPGISNSLSRQASFFQEAKELVEKQIDMDIEKHIRKDDKESIIPLEWLNAYPYPRLLVWRLLQPMLFTSAQMEEVLALAESQAGARVDGPDHYVLKDRDCLYVAQRTKHETVFILVEELPVKVNTLAANIDLSICPMTEVHFDGSQEEVFVDMSKLSFPLILRSVREGDRFNPLGMQGTQKLSDFMIQRKISQHQKQDILVLESNGEIVAVIGHRIAELFKVTHVTESALRIAYSVTM